MTSRHCWLLEGYKTNCDFALLEGTIVALLVSKSCWVYVVIYSYVECRYRYFSSVTYRNLLKVSGNLLISGLAAEEAGLDWTVVTDIRAAATSRAVRTAILKH